MDNLAPHLARKLIDEACRSSLYNFVRFFFPIAAPGVAFEESWVMELFSYEAELALKGQTRRLTVEVCPRSGKSIIFSVLAPAWHLGRRPQTRFVCASYSLDLSVKLARDSRRVMQDPAYLRMFPNTRIDRAKNAGNEFETTAGGGRFTTSLGASLTGRGGDFLIFDDILSANDAHSQSAREAADRWRRGVASTRLNNPSKGSIIIVGQRLHYEDPIGKIMEEEEALWRRLLLPALADEDVIYDLGRGRHHHSKAGDLLLPARMTQEFLEQQRRSMGSADYEPQYQQRPVPEKGNMVQRDWFRFYSPPFRLDPGDRIIQAWDCATKDGQRNDYSVCITAAVRGGWDTGDIIVLDIFRDRLQYPFLRRKVLELHDRYRPRSLIIEDAAAGSPLIQDLRQGTHLWPEGIRPVGDKIQRLAIQSAKIEGRRVWLPKGDPAAEALLAEVISFPSVKHDDQVDALTLLLGYLDELESKTVRQYHA